MNLKSITSILLFLSILLVSGCSTDKSNVYDQSSNGQHTIKSQIKSDNGVNAMISGTIEIYQVKRENLYYALENTSYDNLKNGSKCYKYLNEGGNYQTSSVTLFKVKKEFIDFFSKKELLQNFLAENQIKSTIEDVVIFDAPHTPLSVWIKTISDDVFITVNELYDDEDYVYRIYSNSDYCRKYNRKLATLTVDGKDVTNGKKIYMYYDYADLPFTTVCTALGSEVIKNKETIFTIKFKEKEYKLNTEESTLCEINKDYNLFNSLSGNSPYYKYLSNGEFFVDSNTLECVLSEMGKKVSVLCNSDKSTVEIVSK